MASISLTVEGSTVGSITVTDKLSQEHSDRFTAWLVATYGKNDDGEDRSPAEMIEACWSAIRRGVFANVEAYEREVAAQSARDAVKPMESKTAVE